MTTGRKRAVGAKELLAQRNALVCLSKALSQEQTGGVLGTGLDVLVEQLSLLGALAYLKEDDELNLVSDFKLPRKCKAWLTHLVLGDPHPWFVAQRVAQRVKSEIDEALADTRAGLSIEPMLREAGWGAVAATPVAVGREVMGVIVIAATDAQAFEGGVLATVEAACAILALALMRERYYEQQSERAAEAITAQLATAGLVAASVAADLAGPIGSLGVLLDTQQVLVEGLRQALGATSIELDELEEVTFEVAAAARAIGDVTRRLSAVTEESDGGTVDMGKLVRSAVALARPHVDKLGVELDLYGDDQALGVEGRDTDLRLLVVQLLFHAARTCARAGGPKARVVLSLVGEGRRCAISIDTSAAPSAEPLSGEAIFDGWFRRPRGGALADPTLALARQTVLAHDGHIEVGASDLGGLRIRTVFPTSEHSIHPESQRSSFPMPTLRPPQGALPIVLWIDADEIAGRAVCRYFKTHEVRLATTLAAAQAELARLLAAPEMIFCAVLLPDGEGIALHRAAAPGIAERFVFLSDGVIAAEAAAYLHGSGRPTLIKPITFDELGVILEGAAAEQQTLAAPTLRPGPESAPPDG